ncbi:MAG: hypothetical protein IRD7MM_03665 [Candidatus Midichloria mitochondrii]|uniref:hypothetical protein n=1 Tax=Candidatus Midichloria mitochondrii TaxID=234827 RepID=UPI000312D2D5|nr:hypothetical protein [Candidatus Midichloria mitochondrii]MDJ1256902.1 hypothetical protein [Candidatus Midichloria mitochondrii]MDJ1288637.1 hypothetical protein [Candidatus Midichloria mitochondrii]MDJ1299461.1 hypothetical protein [Candidatus Midichloria mitochondrii]MDJ1313534.1 hypothetical protein [Candidatus Midichloria mitochondrii]MDJ1584155.1 hypothetical protein [Candidatus Midichloria mitochondrii]
MEFGYEPLAYLLKFEENLRRDINIEEAIFSYLLFNAGYLTARTEGVRYYFKIPNFEVKRDFALVIRDEIQVMEKDGTILSSKLGRTLLKARDNLEFKNYQ